MKQLCFNKFQTFIFLSLLVTVGACKKDDQQIAPPTGWSMTLELETVSSMKSATDMKDEHLGILRKIARTPIVSRQKLAFKFSETGEYELTITEQQPKRTDLPTFFENYPADYPRPVKIHLGNGKISAEDQFGKPMFEHTVEETALKEILPLLDFENTLSPSLDNILIGNVNYTKAIESAKAQGAEVVEQQSGVFSVRMPLDGTSTPKNNTNGQYTQSLVDTNNNLLVISNLYDANNNILAMHGFKYKTDANNNPLLEAIYQEDYDYLPNGGSVVTTREMIVDNIVISSN